MIAWSNWQKLYTLGPFDWAKHYEIVEWATLSTIHPTVQWANRMSLWAYSQLGPQWTHLGPQRSHLGPPISHLRHPRSHFEPPIIHLRRYKVTWDIREVAWSLREIIQGFKDVIWAWRRLFQAPQRSPWVQGRPPRALGRSFGLTGRFLKLAWASLKFLRGCTWLKMSICSITDILQITWFDMSYMKHHNSGNSGRILKNFFPTLSMDKGLASQNNHFIPGFKV